MDTKVLLTFRVINESLFLKKNSSVLKYPLCYLLLFLCLLGCQTEPKLTIEDRFLTVPSCGDCAKISVQVPKVTDKLKLAKAVNTTIEEELIYTLRFDEEEPITTAEQAAVSFNRSYKKMVKEFGAFEEPWKANIKGTVIFENRELLTIAFVSETYTGGAHGYFSKAFLNFDKTSATELEYFELFDDLQGFITLAEDNFRKTYDIPQKENINATGFMFPNDAFELPKSLGFTKMGIQLYYSPYEVASYADGALTMTIPYPAANSFLKEDYRITN